jgi:transcriptional regulator with XRE-family HTH domain
VGDDSDRPKCPHCMGVGYLTEETATVGSLILYHRRKAGLSQDELASQVGVSRPQIANIESGRHDPPISRLRSFAVALNVKTKDLVP